MSYKVLNMLAAVSVAFAAATARADCVGGVPPQLFPTAGPMTGTGSYLMANDVDVVITNNPHANPIPLLVFRRGSSGWSFDRAVPTNSRPDMLAMRDGYVAALMASGPPLVVFRFDPVTGNWPVTGNIPLSAAGIEALCIDSSTLFVGYQGGVLLYSLSPSGVPAAAGSIVDPEPGPDRHFGRAIAVQNDLAAIAAPLDGEVGPSFGAVYIYRLNAGSWSLVQKLRPSASPDAPHFGRSLCLHGGRLAVGALRSDHLTGESQAITFANGYVRVYEWDGANFQLEAHLTNPRGLTSAPIAFGESVAIRGDRLLVGASRDSVTGAGSGGAYLYERTDGSWLSRGVLALSDGAGAWFGFRVGLADRDAVGLAPLYDQGNLALAVFGECALPATSSDPTRCAPGLPGLISFIMQWFSGDVIADYDHDGTLTVGDLFAFLQIWLAGCP